MVSPAIDVLSVFMTPWMKPTSSQRATRSAWRAITALEQRAIGLLARRRLGIVAGDDVVGEQAQRLDVAARGEELEGADADVAGRHARQDRAGQRPSRACTGSPVVDGGQRRAWSECRAPPWPR